MGVRAVSDNERIRHVYVTLAQTVYISSESPTTLLWRHNGRDGVSNHQPHDCIPNRSFRRTSKKTPKLRVTGLCAGNSPVTGEFPAQTVNNAENASIWWRHHEKMLFVAKSPSNTEWAFVVQPPASANNICFYAITLLEKSSTTSDNSLNIYTNPPTYTL